MNTSISLHIKAGDEIHAKVVEASYAPDGYITVNIDSHGSHAYLFINDPHQALHLAMRITEAAWDLQDRREDAAQVAS